MVKNTLGKPELKYIEKLYSDLEITCNISNGQIRCIPFVKSICPIKPPKGTEKSFLEFGCGPGHNVLNAALAGYEAYGIELKKSIAELGNHLIKKLKKEGIIDPTLKAKIFYGNDMPKDLLEDLTLIEIHSLKKRFGLRTDIILSKFKKINNMRLEYISDKELDYLEKKIPYHYQLVDTKKQRPVQRFEISYDKLNPVNNQGELIFNEKIDQAIWYYFEANSFLLENPYSDENKDVYDIMDKQIKDFDYFYSYCYSVGFHKTLTAEILRRHRKKKSIWKNKSDIDGTYETNPHVKAYKFPLNITHRRKKTYRNNSKQKC